MYRGNEARGCKVGTFCGCVKTFMTSPFMHRTCRAMCALPPRSWFEAHARDPHSVSKKNNVRARVEMKSTRDYKLSGARKSFKVRVAQNVTKRGADMSSSQQTEEPASGMRTYWGNGNCACHSFRYDNRDMPSAGIRATSMHRYPGGKYVPFIVDSAGLLAGARRLWGVNVA